MSRNNSRKMILFTIAIKKHVCIKNEVNELQAEEFYSKTVRYTRRVYVTFLSHRRALIVSFTFPSMGASSRTDLQNSTRKRKEKKGSRRASSGEERSRFRKKRSKSERRVNGPCNSFPCDRIHFGPEWDDTAPNLSQNLVRTKRVEGT